MAPRPLPSPVPAPAADGPHGSAGQFLRGGAITGLAQGLRFVLNIGSTVVLARLLTPSDYGLFAMVTAFTGIAEVFKDGGLSLATVQRDRISHAQLSSLFWMNAALGGILTLVTLGLIPVVIRFYSEPQLGGIMAAVGLTFLINGLGVQHQALLRRNLRFAALAAIDILSLVAGSTAALLFAWRGHGGWALVAMAVGTSFAYTVSVWLAVPWRPGRSASFADVRPLLGFGGGIIVTRLLYQVVRGAPSLLLGWFWGAPFVGLYQRAYTLLMFAVDQIQGPVASVVLPQLSRLQHDPQRLKDQFLVGYRLIVSVILPVVATCAVYAEELVALMLGPQWGETAAIFRWLALGGIMVGLLNPQGLLLLSLGRARSCAIISMGDAVGVLAGYLAGVAYGAVGVAIGFCAAKLLLCGPVTYFTFRGTPVGWRDVVAMVRAPLLATAAAALGGLALKLALAPVLAPRVLAVVGCAGTLALYAALLLFGARQWTFYRGLFDGFLPRRTPA